MEYFFLLRKVESSFRIRVPVKATSPPWEEAHRSAHTATHGCQYPSHSLSIPCAPVPKAHVEVEKGMESLRNPIKLVLWKLGNTYKRLLLFSPSPCPLHLSFLHLSARMLLFPRVSDTAKGEWPLGRRPADLLAVSSHPLRPKLPKRRPTSWGRVWSWEGAEDSRDWNPASHSALGQVHPRLHPSLECPPSTRHVPPGPTLPSRPQRSRLRLSPRDGRAYRARGPPGCRTAR